jgi:hypothetical protein
MKQRVAVAQGMMVIEDDLANTTRASALGTSATEDFEYEVLIADRQCSTDSVLSLSPPARTEAVFLCMDRLGPISTFRSRKESTSALRCCPTSVEAYALKRHLTQTPRPAWPDVVSPQTTQAGTVRDQGRIPGSVPALWRCW